MQPQTKDRLRAHIRWTIRRDMPEVLAIEGASFSQPWTEDDFLRYLRERNRMGFVAEHRDTVVGYMLFGLHKGRIQLGPLAVSPAWRRQGVGSLLVTRLREKIDRSFPDRSRITCTVRETNLPAQQFLASQGFRATQVLRSHYDGDGDTGEDAYAMEYRHPGLDWTVEEILAREG